MLYKENLTLWSLPAYRKPHVVGGPVARSWARLSPLMVDAAGVVMPSGISQRERNSPRTEVEPESGPINVPTTPNTAFPVVNQTGCPLLSGLAGV